MNKETKRDLKVLIAVIVVMIITAFAVNKAYGEKLTVGTDSGVQSIVYCGEDPVANWYDIDIGTILTVREGSKFGIKITKNDDTTKTYYLTPEDEMVKEDGFNLVVVEVGKDNKPALIIRKANGGNYMISE